MGAGGFMHDANKKIQYNKSLLSKKNNLFGSIHKYQGNNKVIKTKIQKASPEEIKRVKNIVKKQQTKEIKRRLRLLCFSIIGGLVLAYIFYMWLIA